MIEDIQKERGARYGSFGDCGAISYALKTIVRTVNDSRVEKIPDAAMEGIEMALHKIARIVNGDPMYLDSWIDAESYINLARKEIEKLQINK